MASSDASSSHGKEGIAGTPGSLGGRLNDYQFAAFALTVVALNNLLLLWRPNAPPLVGPLATIVLWGSIFVWTVRVERFTLGDLGLRKAKLWKSLTWGALAGIGLGGLGVLGLARPVVLSESVRLNTQPDLAESGVPLALILVVVVQSAAVFEELLFRGLIQERGIRWLGLRGGIGLSCCLFVLWHVAVVSQGIQQTNLTSTIFPWPLLSVGAVIPLAIAGTVFSLLRHRTENLAGSIAAHWLANAIMQGF